SGPGHGEASYQTGQPHPEASMSQLQVPATYVARRNFFNFLGITCRILDKAGGLLFFVKMKAFKLREDITLFKDAARTQPMISIKARQIMDFSACYDVVDVGTGERVGACRRKGFKSILKDEWELLDADDALVGHAKEDSMLLALIRRFLSNLVPQTFIVEAMGEKIGSLKGTWNPFLVKYAVDFSRNQGQLDPRLGLAITVLLLTIEGKQK
ncbi:MAG: hypothetical protein ABIO70_15275, partial [Pseudomonadota bacterium]